MPRVLPVLKLLALAYLLVMLVAFALQRRLLYFPTPAPGEVRAAETRFAVGGLELRGWAVRPDAEDAVLYFGGNAEAVEASLPFLAAAAAPRAVHVVPYRGYSGNPGRPSEAALVADALAVFDELARRHRRVAVVGRSLGSGVAAAVAAQRPVERLVLVTPFDSVLNLARRQFPFLPLGLVLRDRFDSARRAPGLGMPVLVVRAGRDRVVPRRSTEALLAALPQATTELVEIEAADHNDLSSFPSYGEAMSSFLRPAED
jgi:pimeloyl-ACP methyl ester carboxylesterase